MCFPKIHVLVLVVSVVLAHTVGTGDWGLGIGDWGLGKATGQGARSRGGEIINDKH